MFYFLCKRILHGRLAATASQSHKVLCVSKNDPSSLLGVFASLSLRCISSSSKELPFTVSYLKKKCGLSSESALTAAKYVQFKTSDRADTVIAFFKNHGFSEPQITRLIKRRRVVLVSDIEKTLLPKLEFFRSKGASSPYLVKILSDNPTILGSSLEKQIIPSFNCLSNFLSEEKIIDAVKRYPRLLSYDLNAILLPNINLLLDNGVPECNTVTTLHSLPSTLMRGPIQFKDMVDEAKEMGFIPPSQCLWLLRLFEGIPRLLVSEDKFMVTIDFLVNKMGFQSLLIAKHPRILMMSLDKKIVPRGLFA
ncbi:transcription termination factor MTERF15, mitochondrial-like [Herrania umbratica]|uniref:Transcription termination factor MTERF15, mitochondrial-like n=1 Tax=Herrania umbratica TaxID=108875 RepID=A0A6J1AVA7_9ROSI|nr:transcription termination factor MTERF15, mitochondrial-like [Herrania umbratica]